MMNDSRGYVYMIQPYRAQFCKVGMWSGTKEGLCSRYSTPYGKFKGVVIDIVDDDECLRLRNWEGLLHKWLYERSLHLYGEVFLPCSEEIENFVKHHGLYHESIEYENTRVVPFIHEESITQYRRRVKETCERYICDDPVDVDLSILTNTYIEGMTTMTESDKGLIWKKQYLEHYGFKWVDLEFVQEYGTNLFNPIKTVLLAMVWPEYVIEPSGDWKKHNIIQKAAMLNELVSAFGFKHILDYETEVKAVDITSLAKCQYFREYEQACALFELEYNSKKKWTTPQYLQSVRNLLLYRLNIHLENKRVSQSNVRTRIYTLNKESVQRMGDMCVTTIDALDKNWVTKSGHRMLPLAKEALIACRDTHFAKYKQLLKPLPTAPTTEMEALTI